jgi:hypothetical protein
VIVDVAVPATARKTCLGLAFIKKSPGGLLCTFRLVEPVDPDAKETGDGLAEIVKLLNLTGRVTECGNALIVAVTVPVKLANGNGAAPGCVKVMVEVTKPFGAMFPGAVAVKRRPAGFELPAIVTAALAPGKPFRLVTLATAVAVPPGATSSKFGLTTRLKSQILI